MGFSPRPSDVKLGIYSLWITTSEGRIYKFPLCHNKNTHERKRKVCFLTMSVLAVVLSKRTPSFLLPCDKLTQAQKLKTTQTYYLTVSRGEESQNSFLDLLRRIAPGWNHCDSHLRLGVIFRAHCFSAEVISCSCMFDAPVFLLGVSKLPSLEPRGHLQFLATGAPNLAVLFLQASTRASVRRPSLHSAGENALSLFYNFIFNVYPLTVF